MLSGPCYLGRGRPDPECALGLPPVRSSAATRRSGGWPQQCTRRLSLPSFASLPRRERLVPGMPVAARPNCLPRVVSNCFGFGPGVALSTFPSSSARRALASMMVLSAASFTSCFLQGSPLADLPHRASAFAGVVP